MTLQITSVLTLALVALTSAGHEPNGKCKEYGGRYDCPQYQLVRSTDDYEVREYAAGEWVTTETGDSTFMRLFRYIQGANAKNESIPMTAPVIMPHELSADGTVSSDAKAMSFYINGEAPEPTEEGVDLDPLSSFTAYVRSYGGYSSARKVRQNVKRVWDALTDEQRARVTEVYVAGYDSPFRFFGRHNEVWLVEGHY